MSGLPAAVWRLIGAFALMMAGTSMIVLLAGIISTEIAPSPDLATLPIALSVVGLAGATLPTGRLLVRFGRRRVFLAYGVIAIGGALLAAASLSYGNFTGFCAASLVIGWASAAGHQYRFAALESVSADLAPKATSALLLGGLLGAFIGPELALRGRWLAGAEYAGSFLLLAGSYVLGLVILSFHRDAQSVQMHHARAGRPLLAVLASAPILLAMGAAALGNAVMSFIMTATPISMHLQSGHSQEAAKYVIQAHIAAMYLPSLVYGGLCARIGLRGMLWLGGAALASCLAIALVNTAFLHYWLALVLLGIGWNFLFLTGTNLLPFGYRPEERYLVQSTNDFVVFSVQAAASLSSGWVLHHWRWNGLLWACVPLLLAFAVVLARFDFRRLANPARTSGA